MSDTSKKRSRKSKLVPRDCGEDDENKKIRMEELTKTLLSELETEDRQLDSLPNPFQTFLPKLRTQLDKSYGYDDADTSTRDMKFSVNIEVEECHDDNDPGSHENEDSDIEIHKNYEESKSRELKWPICISDEEYRSVVTEKLSKVKRSLADQVIEVHIRNYLGRYVNEVPDEMDYFQKSIQDILKQVLHWQKLSKLREAILSYKCYVCDIGWWHLGPFQDHVREHGEAISISFQISPHEGSIVAHFDHLTSNKEIPIEGRCWQCMKTWDEHANLKRNSQPFYSCAACTFKSPVCSALLEHEGLCLGYHKEYIKETINYETKSRCSICHVNCITEERLKAHMTLSHFARSDFLCYPPVLKKCATCGLSYVYHMLHPCRYKPFSVFCNYCLKRFPGKFLAYMHMTYTKKNVHCVICNMYLRSQCLEVEHMARHSKNYVLLYKCVFCPNINFFNTEKSIKEHRRVHSDKKCVRNISFEMMIAPRKLFPALPFNEDEMIGSLRPHILGPKLAPVPKKPPTVMDHTIAETQSAVDAIRYDHMDVHGHDYLLHPYSADAENIPAQKDHTQQQVADDTIAAVQSISDVTIKTETEDYEYYNQTEMDIVYEDTDIKKEQFLDTLSNVFITAEDVTGSVDDQDNSNVFQVSKQIVTVIKEEKKVSELLSEFPVETEEVGYEIEKNEIKKEDLIDEDDFEDDIIVLSNGNITQKNYTVDEIDDNDDVTLIKQVSETIDISDTEMQDNEDDSNAASDKHNAASSNENHETSSNETNKENYGVYVKKERAKNKIYKCTKCDFKAEHRQFQKHLKTKCCMAKGDCELTNDQFPCTKCKSTYKNFKSYVLHLREHDLPPKTCPECLQIFTHQTRLMHHLEEHIKAMFTEIHVILKKDTFITSRRDNVYQCSKCVHVVKCKKFFKHWEGHLKLGQKGELEMEFKIERSKDIEEGDVAETELSEDKLNQLLDLLQAQPTRLEPNSNHSCVLCEQRPFSRPSYLKTHYVAHLLSDAVCKRARSRTETVACQICSEQFNDNQSYKQHMRNHANLPVYRCERCSRTFSNSSNFAKHRKVHNMVAAACDVCGSKFFKKASLIKHMQIHQHTKPIKSEQCPKISRSFSYKDSDESTTKSKGWPRYPCTKCNSTHANLKSYVFHLREHKIPPNACPECYEVFTRQSQLLYHLKAHIRCMFTNLHIILEPDSFITSRMNQVYQCKKCVHVVKYKNFFKHWEGHLQLEDKRELEVEVECKIERSENVDEGNLAEMELSADMLKRLLNLLRSKLVRCDSNTDRVCVLCGRPFTRAPYLKRHYVEHLLGDAMCRRVRCETETIACQICGEQFNHNLHYKQHMRNHANLPVYRCELCSRSFSDSSNFAKHKKVHNMAAAVCDLCGTKFTKKESLIKHMQIHQATEPIKCAHCPKVFHAPSQHRRHVRSAHSARGAKFTCSVCLVKFPTTRARLDHMWTVHLIRKMKVDCPICNRSFRKYLDMKQHLKVKHNAGLKLSSKHFFSASETDRYFSWVHLNEKSGTKRGKGKGTGDKSEGKSMEEKEDCIKESEEQP